MAKSLIDRLRASRQSTVEAGGWKFTVTRPTDMDMLDMQGKVSQASVLRRFVIGWNLTEIDVIGGAGTGEPAEFSADLFAEWVADRPHLWPPLSEAIVNGYRAHEAETEAAIKNSTPG